MKDKLMAGAIILVASLALFAAGVGVGADYFGKNLPFDLEVQDHKGDTYFAELRQDNFEMLQVSGGDNPGVFIAFPVYGENQ